MQTTIRTLALCTIAAVTLPALAADNPWFGTWKLDPAKSHMTGDTFTYSKVAGGMDHYSNGPISFDFTANGIDYPVMANATTAWVASGPNQWKETDKTNGTVTSYIRHQAHPELQNPEHYLDRHAPRWNGVSRRGRLR